MYVLCTYVCIYIWVLAAFISRCSLFHEGQTRSNNNNSALIRLAPNADMLKGMSICFLITRGSLSKLNNTLT